MLEFYFSYGGVLKRLRSGALGGDMDREVPQGPSRSSSHDDPGCPSPLRVCAMRLFLCLRTRPSF